MQSVKIFQGEDPQAVEKQINEYLLEEHGPEITQVVQSETPATDSHPAKVTVTLVLKEPY